MKKTEDCWFDPQDQLLNLVRNRDTDKALWLAREFIQHGKSLGFCSSDERDLRMTATRRGMDEVLDLLNEEGVSEEVMEKEGCWFDPQDQLLNLVEKEDTDKALWLAGEFIKHGESLGFLSSDGRNLLMTVSREGMDDLLDLLYDEEVIEEEININAKDQNGSTALMQTVSAGNSSTAGRLIINCRAHLNLENEKGMTALDIAEDENASADMIDLLIKNGAKRSREKVKQKI